jgi:hypothetical protein
MSMFFKLFGLRYATPSGSPHFNDKEYLSNLQFARTGDVLVDESGVPISFGAVGIAYGIPPNPATMTPEETDFWFNLATSSVWSRTLLADGVTVVDVDTGPSGQGDMLKSVYDTNNDGIVNAADKLQTGLTSVTAGQVISHIADLSIHRPMNDALTTTTNLWSAAKTASMIAAGSALFSVGVSGIVIGPTAPQAAGEYYLRADNSWQLNGLSKSSIVSPQQGDLLVYGPGGLWYNAEPSVGPGLSLDLSFGSGPVSLVLYNTLTLATLPGVALNGLQDEQTLQYSAYEGKWVNVSLSIGFFTVRPHSMLQNLTADDHPQYALLSGRSGGQFLLGGIDVDDTLFLRGTSDASFGNVSIQGSGSVDYVGGKSIFRVYDAASGYIAMCGETTPQFQFYDPILTGTWHINLINDGRQLLFTDWDADNVMTIDGALHDVYFLAGMRLADTSTALPGMIRYHGGSYQGYSPSGWQTFAATSLMLQYMEDVSLYAPQAGQVLTWDGYYWVNQFTPVLLGELYDVSLATVIAGQALVFDGANWINQDIPRFLWQLSDISVLLPQAGESLVYNGAAWVNQAPVLSLGQLQDVDLIGTEPANLLMLNDAGQWINVRLLTGGVMTAEFDEYTRSLVLTASPGSSAGVPNLRDLTDVGGITYTAGNMLVADGNLWQSVQMSGAATMTYQGVVSVANGAIGDDQVSSLSWSKISKVGSKLSDLADTFMPAPLFGQAPVWNGASWVNDYLGQYIRLGELSDVNTDYASQGDLLIYTGGIWHNVTLLATGGASWIYDPAANTLLLNANLSQGSLLDIYDRRHSLLEELTIGDDHTQYVSNTLARTISAVHAFNPGTATAPIILGANAIGQLVSGFNADLLDGQHAAAFQPISANLSGLASLASTGIVVRSAANTFITRSIQAGSTRIGVSNGSGVGGNVAIDVNEANLKLANMGGSLPWGSLNKAGSSIDDLSDVNTSYAVAGNLLMYTGSAWKTTTLVTSAGISASYDGTTLHLSGTGAEIVHDSLSGLQGGSACAAEFYHLTGAEYSGLSSFFSLPMGGYLVHLSNGTFAVRSLTAGSTKIGITYGDGQTGNTAIDVNQANLDLASMGGTLAWAQLNKLGSSINDLGDVNTDYAVAGDLFIYTGSAWKSTPLLTAGSLTATYDGNNLLLTVQAGVSICNGSFPVAPYNGQLAYREDLEVAYLWSNLAAAWIDISSGGSGTGSGGGAHNTLTGLQGGLAGSEAEFYHLDYAQYLAVSTPASASQDGYLTSADWTTFSAKQGALSFGNLTAGSSKISIGGTGTGAVIGAGASIDVNEANLTLGNLGGILAWSKVSKSGSSIGDLGDVTMNSPVVGELFMYSGSKWVNVQLLTSGITATFDPTYHTLTLSGGGGDVSTALLLAPATSARNVTQPTSASVTPLTLKGYSGQSANLTEWQNSSTTVLASINSIGVLATPRVILTPVSAAGATPVDTDVIAWDNNTLGFVLGTGGRVFSAFKNSSDVYYVELTGV